MTEPPSIRKRVFALLDKNPYLQAKFLAKMLDLPYQKYKRYLWDLRKQWKLKHEIEHGSKCSTHAWRGWVLLPAEVTADVKRHEGLRLQAVGMGWVRTKSRNKWLLWRDYLGRLQWFETGRVNLYVRKPANIGRAVQLLANGLFMLIGDLKKFEEMRRGIRFKGAHYVFDAGTVLPKMVIDVFDRSNGITIKIGDRTHPHGVEVLVHYPDWSEKNEMILFQAVKAFKMNMQAFDRLNETLKSLASVSSEVLKRGDRTETFLV